MKRLHAGAKSRKHGCSRCGEHKSKIIVKRRKTGKLYAICEPCLRSRGNA